MAVVRELALPRGNDRLERHAQLAGGRRIRARASLCRGYARWEECDRRKQKRQRNCRCRPLPPVTAYYRHYHLVPRVPLRVQGIGGIAVPYFALITILTVSAINRWADALG